MASWGWEGVESVVVQILSFLAFALYQAAVPILLLLEMAWFCWHNYPWSIRDVLLPNYY